MPCSLFSLTDIALVISAYSGAESRLVKSSCSWLGPRRSLCIIDEFGKGTLCADGVGLLCAALRHFAAQQPSCKLIACTHFSEVLDEAYLARRCPAYVLCAGCMRLSCRPILVTAPYMKWFVMKRGQRGNRSKGQAE